MVIVLGRRGGGSGSGAGSQPPVPFVQNGDPGTVGEGALWVDTSSDPPVLKIRNTANDGWVTSGGSQPVTDSWLVATDTAPLTTDGLLPWTLTGSDGADIAVNGGDSTLIDILTTGIYVISFAARFTGDATGEGNIQVTFFGEFGGFMEASGVGASSPVVPPSFDQYEFITSPPIPITAPLQVAINAGFTTLAGEIAVDGVITIVRIF